MPIIGIDYDKCINCGNCLSECTYFFKKIEGQDKIIFEDPHKRCNGCGHCIAICPEDAIIYEDLGQSYTFEGVEKPEIIASYDTIYKFLRANRSIRRYKKDKIPVEILQKIFNAMQCAPTAGNMRIEKFSILSDPDQIKSLSDAVKKTLLNHPKMRERSEEEFAILEKKYKAPIFYDAPHVIFVYTPFSMTLEGFNIGNIITYGRLAAQSLGLGTCWNGWTQIAIELNPKIKKLAHIKGNMMCAFTIGYPDLSYYRAPPRSQKRVKGLK